MGFEFDATKFMLPNIPDPTANESSLRERLKSLKLPPLKELEEMTLTAQYDPPQRQMTIVIPQSEVRRAEKIIDDANMAGIALDAINITVTCHIEGVPNDHPAQSGVGPVGGEGGGPRPVQGGELGDRGQGGSLHKG